MKTSYQRVISGVCLTMAAMSSSLALAATEVKKPVRIIVAYAAGGASDTVARYVADKLSPMIEQTVIVENRPGADGNIAAELVASTTERDNYTLLVSGPSTHAANTTIYEELPFDPDNDFRPMSSLVNTPYVLLVNPDRVKESSLKEFLETQEKSPTELFFASANVGGRIAGELFTQQAELNGINVPYKSSPQAITDLIRGEFDYYFCDSVTAIPQIEAGKVKALAISTAARMENLPDTPTMQDVGFDDFDVSSWIAIWSAAAVPAEESDFMAEKIAEILSTEEAEKFITQRGLVPLPSTPDELREIQERDTEEWGEIIISAGMQQY